MNVISALGVLMIGHSLIGPLQPALLEQLLHSRAPEARVQAQVINGAPLIWNWNHSSEAEGVDARAVLPGGAIDTLILTEALPLANHIKWSESGTFAARFADLARDANPDVRVFVLETWHSRNSGTGVSVPDDAGAVVAWRDRIDADLAQWQGLVDDANARLNDGAPLTLIPAGQAMAQLSDAVAAGHVPGLSDLEPLFADDIHPSPLGHYFVALVSYATITGDDPVGLPIVLRDAWGTALPVPDAVLAKTLQRIARDAVANFTSRPMKAAADAPRPPPAVAAEILATAPVSDAPALAHRTVADIPDGLALNLAPVVDWSTQLPFLDLMKSARPWIGHRPRQWGGMDFEALRAGGHLDDRGWPVALPRTLSSIGTLILTDLPADTGDVAGHYLLRFEGKGIVEVTGRATAVRYARGEVRFDFAPGPGGVDIRIQRTDPADPVRDISVVRADRAVAYDAGAQFNPDWLALLDGVAALRFVNWMNTSATTLTTWDDRPHPDDYSYAPKGVPVEVMLALADEVGADPWFTLPHLADDGFVTAFAQTVRDELAPERRVFAEFSNEVWNFQFPQARWADAMGRARWGAETGAQFYGIRAAEVARLWSAVLPADRLVNVIATQTGWLGLERAILEAPRWVAEKPGNPPPFEAFDAYAVTGYFAGTLGHESRGDMVHSWLNSAAQTEGGGADDEYTSVFTLAAQEARDGSLSGNREDSLQDLLTRILPYHAEVARRHGLALIMYEGGSHATGIGPMTDDPAVTDFLIHFNYTPEMAALYTEAITGWKALGGRLFNAYVDVAAPTKWGSWARGVTLETIIRGGKR